MAKVVIFGCGRGADTAYRYISRDTDHEICGFAVERQFLSVREFHGLPVADFADVVDRFPPGDFHMFVPLGFQEMNGLRKAKYLDAKGLGYRFISYLNSRNYSLERTPIGENCFILDGQILNLDVSIGDNVMMWSGNHVGDRTVIRDHVFISSHVSIAGDVTIGEGCFLGVNASVSNGVTLGARTFVGANTLIARDTADGSVYVAPDAKRVPIASDKFLAMLKLT
jgi:sugar O-acyltransferase (sialic acid O-acetyltransferase NeuD family)